MALIAFVEAALALVNAGIVYLPADELEHVSVHLEHATALAIQEAWSRRIGSRTPIPSALSPLLAGAASRASSVLPPSPTVKADIDDLEAKIQSLRIQG